MYPLRDGCIKRRLFMVLSLSKTHAVILRVAILIWEDNHEILTREVFL